MLVIKKRAVGLANPVKVKLPRITASLASESLQKCPSITDRTFSGIEVYVVKTVRSCWEQGGSSIPPFVKISIPALLFEKFKNSILSCLQVDAGISARYHNRTFSKGTC